MNYLLGALLLCAHAAAPGSAVAIPAAGARRLSRENRTTQQPAPSASAAAVEGSRVQLGRVPQAELIAHRAAVTTLLAQAAAPREFEPVGLARQRSGAAAVPAEPAPRPHGGGKPAVVQDVILLGSRGGHGSDAESKADLWEAARLAAQAQGQRSHGLSAGAAGASAASTGSRWMIIAGAIFIVIPLVMAVGCNSLAVQMNPPAMVAGAMAVVFGKMSSARRPPPGAAEPREPAPPTPPHHDAGASGRFGWGWRAGSDRQRAGAWSRSGPPPSPPPVEATQYRQWADPRSRPRSQPQFSKEDLPGSAPGVSAGASAPTAFGPPQGSSSGSVPAPGEPPGGGPGSARQTPTPPTAPYLSPGSPLSTPLPPSPPYLIGKGGLPASKVGSAFEAHLANQVPSG